MPKIIEDQQVYEAVIRVVSERGYSGATTKHMAEAADVSEVSLFRKYGSKPQLVNLAVAAMIAKMDFESAVTYSGDLEADLRRVVETYQNTAVRYRLFFSVVLSEFTRYPELQESFNGPKRVFMHVQDLLMRYMAMGKLQEEDPTEAAAALLGPVMYLAMMRYGVDGDPSPVDLNKHVASFLYGRTPKQDQSLG